VGAQTTKKSTVVFLTDYEYFGFLRRTEGLCINVAAVIKKGLIMPRNNKGIDHIIRTDGYSAKDIALQLQAFFERNM
jgi:hypothetical protein